MSVVAMKSQCMKTIRIHLVKQKRFHTLSSQNTLQIFLPALVERAKSADCDFSCTKLAFQKVSINHTYKFSQKN